MLEETLESQQTPHLQMRKPENGEVSPKVIELISGPWRKRMSCSVFYGHPDGFTSGCTSQGPLRERHRDASWKKEFFEM